MLGQELASASSVASRAVSKPIDIAGISYRREPAEAQEPFVFSTSAIGTKHPRVQDHKQKPTIRVRPVIKKPETPKTSTIFKPTSMQTCADDTNKENINNIKAKTASITMPSIYNIYANPSPSTLSLGTLRLDCPCGQTDCDASTSSRHCWTRAEDECAEREPAPLLLGFRSVGEIIGYANVVRAQRMEALGKLDLAMLHLHSLHRERLARQRSQQQQPRPTTP